MYIVYTHGSHVITMLVTAGSGGGASGGLSSPCSLDGIATANTSIPVSVSTVCVLHVYTHVYTVHVHVIYSMAHVELKRIYLKCIYCVCTACVYACIYILYMYM